MHFYDFQNKITRLTHEYVSKNMKEVKPTELGLDIRAGYRLYVNSYAIAVEKRNAGTLDYYGGFEYVDKDCRYESGQYVFYTSDDERVLDHIQQMDENVTD